MVSVPHKTSKYDFRGDFGKGNLAFAPELIPLILKRDKTLTYRYGDKYSYLHIGDVVNIIDQDNSSIVGTAIIRQISNALFGDIPINQVGHESYSSKEHQREVLSGYYGELGRPLEDKDSFLIIEFEIIKLEGSNS